MTSNHEVEYSYVRTYIQQLRHGGQSRPTIADIIQFAMPWSLHGDNLFAYCNNSDSEEKYPHIVDISTVIPVHDQCPLGAN